MQLKPFLLDAWLDTYEHGIEFNLAASTGPRWTLNEILNFVSEDERQRFLNHNLVYSRHARGECRGGTGGHRCLRGAACAYVARRRAWSERNPTPTGLHDVFRPA